MDYQDKIARTMLDFKNGNTDAQEFVTDVLTDLRHFAEQQGVEFDDALDSSAMHFLAESLPPASYPLPIEEGGR